MKAFAKPGLVLFGILLLLAGCGTVGGGDKPAWNQQQLSSYLGQQNQDIGAVVQDLQNDPAIGSLVTSPVKPVSLAAGIQLTAQALSGRPFSLMPLALQSLPRGGLDYTQDPQNPTQYTPQAPTDFELKWSAANNQTAVLSVDWDKNGAPTKALYGQDGNDHEMPTHAGVSLAVGGQNVGSADFTASYDHCNATGKDINQANQANFSATLGSQATLGLSFGLTQNDTKIGLTAGVSATAASGDKASFNASLDFNGQATRDANCFITDFTVNSGRLTLTTETDTQAHGHHTTTFDATATNLRRDPTTGALTSIDVSGSLKADGQTVATFSGTLDDFNANCPGAHVTVHTASGDTTLSQLLAQAGVCTP